MGSNPRFGTRRHPRPDRYLAVAIFAVQALVTLLSPAVALARQPDMIEDACRA